MKRNIQIILSENYFNSFWFMFDITVFYTIFIVNKPIINAFKRRH